MCATGEGSISDPLVVEHKDSASIDKQQELINAIGKPSDTDVLSPYYMNGAEGNPPIPYNVTQLLRCIGTGLTGMDEKVDAAKQATFNQAQQIGHMYDQPATYEQVVGVDQYGNLTPLTLIQLAKGILIEVHLLRTGVAT